MTADPDDVPSCRFCDEPAEPDDEHVRCERCIDDDLRQCISTGCNGVATDGHVSCRLCRDDFDDCAREDAAEAMRDAMRDDPW